MKRQFVGFASALALLLVVPAGISMSAQATVQAAQTQAAASQDAPLPKVFLFATGGTISNRDGGRLTVDELIASIPGLDRRVRGEGEQFANAASSSLTLDQWLDLSRRINARFKSDAELSGVVVTSGTDTLEELAYFLHLTVRDERPVVVVGSMRNPSTLGYEGAANLEDAFRAAADPASRGMGTVVVLNDEINSAREVTKTDALRLDTFESRRYGVLGVVDSDRVAYFRKPLRRHSAQSEFDVTKIAELPRVDVILTYQGATGDVITSVVDSGAKGVVMATAGAGATSGTQGEGMTYAVGKEVFVVTTTRTGSGRIMSGRGRRGQGGGPTYRIAGDDLNPIKARILLMLAIATTNDGAEIQRMFSEY
ncbi:MAG: asparaginase [Acidobacteria bacterium]|jgi:L-asparaginase|nr:asparaginase [Acidobacteriota bacterium]